MKVHSRYTFAFASSCYSMSMGCCINTENGYRTHSLHLHLRQIVYGNTMLQFDANANVDANGNEVADTQCTTVII